LASCGSSQAYGQAHLSLESEWAKPYFLGSINSRGGERGAYFQNAPLLGHTLIMNVPCTPNQLSGLVLNCLKNPKKKISTEFLFLFFKEQNSSL
jgi:hypothetical protein